MSNILSAEEEALLIINDMVSYCGILANQIKEAGKLGFKDTDSINRYLAVNVFVEKFQEILVEEVKE